MAYEIFSIKLYELDEKIRRLHSRIQMSESAQHSKITDEIQTLRKECEETELMLARESMEAIDAQMTQQEQESEGNLV